MKTKYFFLAALAGFTLASCSSDDFVGDLSPTASQVTNETEAINFGFNVQNTTRGNIVGNEAAKLLGQGFYVVGTKGSEGEYNPSGTLVFDNYLVHYANNTAGTTESNTANWEYVGITPGAGSYTNWVKLSSLNAQTIKYWDYTEEQYDFLAFSTGTKKAVNKNDLSQNTTETDDDVTDDEIGVTAMVYGEGLKNGATAYTFYIPTIEALKNVYITDVTTVEKASYGQEVKLTFKNLGSKIRLALYETVPGYSVKDVKFYTTVGAATPTDLGSGTSSTAYLITADATYGFSTRGTAVVSFPKLGTENASNGNYKKASVSVTAVEPESEDLIISQNFGGLANFQGKELEEDDGNYLGRNITEATYAGLAAVDYYQVVFPVTSSSALTLRVDYTLVSTDGSDEEIKVYGAKAVVPSTYTVWQPNYAYTYIFKISDNTNGWTSTDATEDPAGLFPITFDAVVAEIKDVSGEQTTVTTVATPSITTYQQGHDHANKDEYSKTASTPPTTPTVKDIYVQVMDNELASPVLVGTTGSSKPLLNATSPYQASVLYAVTSPGKKYSSEPAGWPNGFYTDNKCTAAASGTFSAATTYYKLCTEADVMDALQNRTTGIGANDVTGRNGVVLTKNTNINAGVTSIVNGVDDKAITLSSAGQAAKIDMTAVDAGTYAYVYDYSTSKNTKTFYQPTGLAVNSTIPDGKKYITLVKLGTITATTTGTEEANDDYIYFSKTTTDGEHFTYSYYSVEGKTGNLPADLLKVKKDTDLLEGDGVDTKVVAGTFVFDIYTRNDGNYAVKVIKIVP